MEAGLPVPPPLLKPLATRPPAGGSKGSRRPWWRALPGLPYVLLALSLLGAFLLGAKLSSVPLRQPDTFSSRGEQQQQQQQGSGSSSGSGAEERVVAEANGLFPRGCKWREVYNKVGCRGWAGCCTLLFACLVPAWASPPPPNPVFDSWVIAVAARL